MSWKFPRNMWTILSRFWLGWKPDKGFPCFNKDRAIYFFASSFSSFARTAPGIHLRHDAQHIFYSAAFNFVHVIVSKKPMRFVNGENFSQGLSSISNRDLCWNFVILEGKVILLSNLDTIRSNFWHFSLSQKIHFDNIGWTIWSIFLFCRYNMTE